ncbi:hypothetical protein LINGRAHAP2_LOCUS17251 [Linum grandiflorum]
MSEISRDSEPLEEPLTVPPVGPEKVPEHWLLTLVDADGGNENPTGVKTKDLGKHLVGGRRVKYTFGGSFSPEPGDFSSFLGQYLGEMGRDHSFYPILFFDWRRVPTYIKDKCGRRCFCVTSMWIRLRCPQLGYTWKKEYEAKHGVKASRGTIFVHLHKREDGYKKDVDETTAMGDKIEALQAAGLDSIAPSEDDAYAAARNKAEHPRRVRGCDYGVAPSLMMMEQQQEEDKKQMEEMRMQQTLMK